MQSVTILGLVRSGRILTTASLSDFEGKEVFVTLVVPPTEVEADDEREADTLDDPGRIRLPPVDLVTFSGEIVDVESRAPRVYSDEDEG